MKKITKLFVVCAMMLSALFASAEAVEVATIAEAKKLDSYTDVVFTGELTLQYVALTSAGINYFALDSNNDYIRLRSYYWSDIFGTENQLYVGNTIKITGEMQFVNDDNSCATFELGEEDLATIEVTGLGYRQVPTIVTIEDLKADTERVYNANFVAIEGANVESFWDLNVSPFPVNDIVVGEDRIPFTMEGIMTDFPAKVNIIGYVDYENGQPKLYIPQFDGFVEPVAFDNISGMKHFKGQLGYDNVEFSSAVLVTGVDQIDTAYIYLIQKNDASGNPSALRLVVPKSMNLVYQPGDSVDFNVVGHYIPAIYEERVGAIDKMSSSVINVEQNIASTLLSQNNSISMSSYSALLVEDSEEYWVKYDNCLVTTLKGKVITSDELTAAGCIALRLQNVVAGKYDTVLVANTYYAEVGSPAEAIVCGFVGGYEYADTAYTALIPRSKTDFLSELMEFDNIAAMRDAGTTPSRDISYKLNSPMAITGFSSVTDNGYTVYMIFVQDATGYIQLNHNSKKLQNELKVGDVITGATGFYVGHGGSSYYTDEFGYVFATAPVLEVEASSIVASEEQYVAVPVEITLAELNDSYASQLVTIKDVKYKQDTVILSTEDKYLPLIYSGDDWVVVDDSYQYGEEITSITGVYFLYSKLTCLIPRSQEDIVAEGVGIDDVMVDHNIFVSNNTLYANGAQIAIYDVMGRLLIEGSDAVSVANLGTSVIVVRTTYGDTQFVTKMVNR